jgi:hypothetical protein
LREGERERETLGKGYILRELSNERTCVRLSLPCFALPAAESPSTM